MRFLKSVSNLLQDIGNYRYFIAQLDSLLLLQGRQMAELLQGKTGYQSLSELEFKVFSQLGDDGIIQWLVNKLQIENKYFIEFGVSDYLESNTRFLLMNNNWSGLVFDGSKKNIQKIRGSEYYWRHELEARQLFITRDNIDEQLASVNIAEPGLLHIDLDGNDYWILQAIRSVRPVILILEYNSVFGNERAISVPYAEDFVRHRAHYSNLYFGASLPALYYLAGEKGYDFIGCNSAGNNAYFIRRDRLIPSIKTLGLEEGYVSSKFRESRSQHGSLTCLAGEQRLDLIRGLPVVNVLNNALEHI